MDCAGGKDLLVAFYNPLPPASAREVKLRWMTPRAMKTSRAIRRAFRGPIPNILSRGPYANRFLPLLARLLRLTSLQLHESAGQGIANRLVSERVVRAGPVHLAGDRDSRQTQHVRDLRLA
jgi:hypothetical protein